MGVPREVAHRILSVQDYSFAVKHSADRMIQAKGDVFYKRVGCRYLLIVPKPKQMDIERKVSLIIATCKNT